MKLSKKPLLVGFCLVVASWALFYGYFRARAERHRMFESACANGDIRRVALLLRLGADPNGVWDSHYYVRYAWTIFESTPPLHLAAAGGHTDTVRLLLSSGANPARRAIEQMTASDIARLQGHGYIARIIAEAQRE